MIQISGPGATRVGAGNDYEILTLAGIKSLLKLVGTENDTVLQALLDGVHQAAHQFTGGRIFKLNTAPYVHLYDGPGDTSLALAQYPVDSVTSVEEGRAIDSSGTFSVMKVFGTTEYMVDKQSGVLHGIQGAYFPRARHSFKIVFTAGYTSGQLPADIQRAFASWIGTELKRVDKKSWDVASETINQESKAFQLGEMPPATEAVLRRFRRMEALIG